MTKVLVTGAGGYIGSIATYLLLQKGHDVVAFDNFSTGYKKPLELFIDEFTPDKLKVYEGDLAGDIEKVFDENKFDAVLHYAAKCSVTESMDFPEKYFSNNVCGSQALLSAMLAHGVNKLVFSSTCAVYGESEYVPIDEKHPTKPSNPYGESKLMVEKMIEWYGQQRGLKYVILRYFNVCGASDDGRIGDSKNPSVHLMQNAVRGALGLSEFFLTAPKVDTPDGTPIRDYVNVVDLNEAHIKALEYLEKGGESQKINLGTGHGNSVMEIVEMVQSATGKKFDFRKGEERKGEYAKMIADITKAREILGWEPTHTLADSVNSLVTWYTQNPKGWEE